MDIFIFVVFLVITLIVGLSTGRQVKTIQDYALGGRNFSTATLTATIVATWMGGDAIFYTVTNAYRSGLYSIIPILGWAVCIVLTGQLAIRMDKFLNNVSVAEAIGDLYGKKVQVITGVFGVLSCIGCIAIQLKVTFMVITLMWGVKGLWVAVLVGIIFIAYSALGGIRSVTFIDVVQFFTFGTFIPVVALLIWNNLKTPTDVLDALASHSNFNIRKVVGWNTEFIGSMSLLLFFMIPGVDPAIFQRIAMGRNIRQVKRAFTYAAVPFLVILLFMIWISILLLSTDDGLPPDNLVNHIIHQYAHPGLKGLLGTGIIAMAMSTSDAYINASAVLLSNDIAKPLNMLAIQNQVLAARLFAIVGGVLALLLAIGTDNLLALALLPGSFYMPVVTVPLLMTIFGFRTSTKVVLRGMLLGVIVTSTWQFFLAHTDIASIAPGMLANLITLLGSHYLLGEPGGWQKVDPYSPLGLARTARKEAWQRRIQAIRYFKLYPYLQQNLPQQEGLYSLFGFYAIMATYGALYAIEPADVKAYDTIYEGIVQTGFFATTAFLTFPIWPPAVKSQRFITFFWPLGMAALLFFAGTLIAIMSHLHHLQMMILMINLLIAVLLLRWPLALVLAASGVSLAILFFHYYTGEALPWSELGTSQYRLAWRSLLTY